MVKYRNSLPDWVLTVVLAYVRGYEDLKSWYRSSRQDILWQSRELGQGLPGAVGQVGRPVEQQVGQLDQLEQSQNARRFRAVEQALALVGEDLGDSALQSRLQRALLLNCASGRRHPYESFNLPGIYRDDFYRRRHLFLYQIALHDGLLSDLQQTDD